MTIRLYNSRTRAVEPLRPRDPGRVRVYVCGLTPSAQAHLGHARSFLFFDVLRRHLRASGYGVEYVQNVTDVDDRSIAAAAASGRDWREVVEAYYAAFVASMRILGVEPPDAEPRATAHIPEILAMVEGLLARGCAYVAEDAVYFRVASFPRYGAFAGRDVEELLVGARVAPGEHKTDPLDFALWKFAKPGEPSWPAPWGAGRPGWHIECSAMSQALLGLPLDIHGGGTDLIFPHHENEIAQTESLYPPPLATTWVHGGLLLFDGRKMSKSLGNFEPLSSLLERHDPQAVRLLFLQTGYRKPMNFTEAALTGAAAGLRRLREGAAQLREGAAGPEPAAPEGSAAREAVETLRRRFTNALDDDMNTSLALSTLFELTANARGLIDGGGAAVATTFLDAAAAILGIPFTPVAAVAPAPDLRPDLAAALREAVAALGAEPVADLPDDPLAAIDATLAARAAARVARDYARSDHLRDALGAVGILVKDDRGGTTWRTTP